MHRHPSYILRLHSSEEYMYLPGHPNSDGPQDSVAAGQISDHHVPAVFLLSGCIGLEIRQAISGGCKSTTFQLDVLEEDILVWCVTRKPFHARQQVQAPSSTPCQGSALAGSTNNQQGERSVHTSSGQDICRLFNYRRCTKGAKYHYVRKCWGPGCGGDHPATACPHTKQAPM